MNNLIEVKAKDNSFKGTCLLCAYGIITIYGLPQCSAKGKNASNCFNVYYRKAIITDMIKDMLGKRK
jgi:hypothetical protein